MIQIIGGIHKHKKLNVPKGKEIRPSASKLREMIFNICQFKIEGALFLDLFAGVGAMGLEALSRGASHATFVDNNRHSLQALEENIKLLKETNRSTVLGIDVFRALERLVKENKTFDFIFADPPYGTAEKSLSEEVLKFIDANPILSEKGELFLEDDIDAVHSHESHQTLEILSTRRVGRTVLRHFQRAS